MHNKQPNVSVIMPVYNAEEYLEQAIDSILGQTFTDFEFIIIDDASSDNSLSIMKSYNDSRIIILQNETNQKLIASLNRGIQAARGRYIARMDADDISLPERFARQVNFLDHHPDIAVCGTWIEMFGKCKPIILCMPEEPELIKCLLLFTNCIAHPSVMLRRELLGRDLSYSPLYPHAEDYKLWVTLAQKYAIANIPQALLKYRISQGQIGAKYQQRQWETVLAIQLEQLNALGIRPTKEEALLHLSVSFGTILPGIFREDAILPLLNKGQYLSLLTCNCLKDPLLAQAALSWFTKLSAANATLYCYPEPAFTNVLEAYQASVCNI